MAYVPHESARYLASSLIRANLRKALYEGPKQCEIGEMDLRSLTPLLGWSALLVAAALTTGCMNHTSEYVPPKDGRARAIWQEDRVVASLPAKANSTDCAVALNDVQADPVRYRTYYGGAPTIVVWRPWIVVTSTNRVSSSPRPRVPASPTAVKGASGGSGSGGSFGSGGGGSSGGGGGGDLGKAAIGLVVIAILALPFINLGVGLGRPEPSEQVAAEIDKVNAYNDLARLSDSPCGGEVTP